MVVLTPNTPQSPMAKKNKKKNYMHVFWGRTHINTGLIVSHVPGREKMPRHQNIPVFLRVPRILYCSLKRLYGVCITYGNTTMQTAEGV